MDDSARQHRKGEEKVGEKKNNGKNMKEKILKLKQKTKMKMMPRMTCLMN